VSEDPGGIIPFDLTVPTKLLAPEYSPLQHFRDTPVGRSQGERARLEREARYAGLTAALAQAIDAWGALYDRLEDNIVATSVLLIHKPSIDSDDRPIVCTHCEQYNGYEDVEPVDWPCVTYTAVESAVGA
jgi:hypothetical protein